MARSYCKNNESVQNQTHQKILKIARENLSACYMAHQSDENSRFFDKCNFGLIQYLYNNFSPFHLRDTRSIPVDRACLDLSNGIVI
jgi:hypothetical protein